MSTTTASGGVKYDPATTATSLATAYMSGLQDIQTAQTKRNDNTISALGTLKSALTTFQTSLAGFSSAKNLLSVAATFNSSGYGSASATSSATAGTYSFFVDTLATAHQVAFGVDDSAASGGSLKVNVGGAPAFTVNLGGADKDGDGILTPAELATAINAEATNGGQVSASLVTGGGGSAQLVLTSANTGAASAITLDTSGVNSGSLDWSLRNNVTEMTAAQDAVVYLGDKATGTAYTQASNTFNIISDVTMTFTKAQAAADTPLKLTVGADNSATATNAQTFVDAYNKLKTVLDGLTSVGDPNKGVAAGALANDGALNVLRARMLDSVRTSVSGVTQTLASYGITAARNGQLTLNSTRLNSSLALNPSGLDSLMGSVGASATVVGKLDKAISAWSNSGSGQLSQRQTVATKARLTLETRQTTLDNQYNNAYKRYLAQFTKLQTVQSQMDNTSSMFTALFSSGSNN